MRSPTLRVFQSNIGLWWVWQPQGAMWFNDDGSVKQAHSAWSLAEVEAKCIVAWSGWAEIDIPAELYHLLAGLAVPEGL